MAPFMIKLEQANRIIEAILKRGAELSCRPISAVVVEPGCVVKAFQKEDGASMIRFEMACGKAYAALALGRSSMQRQLNCDHGQWAEHEGLRGCTAKPNPQWAL